MYSSKQFEEYEPIEQTSPYDPAQTLQHHVMHRIFRSTNSIRYYYHLGKGI